MIKNVCCIFLFLLFHTFCSKAQNTVELVLTSNSSDSSFYDICKINDNEFWIGGEHGILKRIDSSANIKTISYKNNGNSIFRMLKSGNSLYIAADSGTLYKFNTESKQLEKTLVLKRFNNICFYDLILSDNGKLIICGGKNKIVKARLAIPSGFIIELDSSLSGKTKILWKSWSNFVWCLAQENSTIYASAFNGKYSKILVADKDLLRFHKKYRFNALVYKIAILENELWVLGSRGIRFQKDGVAGKMDKGKTGLERISGEGCVWNLFSIDNIVYAVTNSGCIYKYFQENWVKTDLKLPGTFYCSSAFNEKDILVAGNGKKIALIKK